MLEQIVEVCKTINHDRDVSTITTHLYSEIDELTQEVVKMQFGEEAGDDGITGECVDVILCAVDLMYNERLTKQGNDFNPEVFMQEVRDTFTRKLNKWQSVYGKN